MLCNRGGGQNFPEQTYGFKDNIKTLKNGCIFTRRKNIKKMALLSCRDGTVRQKQ